MHPIRLCLCNRLHVTLTVLSGWSLVTAHARVYCRLEWRLQGASFHVYFAAHCDANTLKKIRVFGWTLTIKKSPRYSSPCSSSKFGQICRVLSTSGTRGQQTPHFIGFLQPQPCTPFQTIVTLVSADHVVSCSTVGSMVMKVCTILRSPVS